MAKNVDALAMMRTARRQYPAHGPAVPPGCPMTPLWTGNWWSGRRTGSLSSGSSSACPDTAAAAAQWPAHFVAFGLLRLAGTDITAWPYHRRRAALEELFTSLHLEAPWTLSPSTTDPGTARQWLDWMATGPEGLCFERLTEPYRPTAPPPERGTVTRFARPTTPSSEP
ncbi:hypothetical protein BM536_008085 [Streptomyces phaeoluteigriseus]|uniref:ATP-dependent DNA ligase family profile domain-containing protein n=1 Tax=Streptomyces phaeoluteigriseus TaxID=114686 RepID=A0A1V6MUV1_9ACTN|nr:hypothetical protein [Streptomyces phaeoluteigriseus]OQD56250.1 hypothetical protein BM536_008085 [Streptomyces phaeoluteigriseus]